MRSFFYIILLAATLAFSQDFSTATCKTLDGKQFSFADASHQVNIVLMWATWCLPCHKELAAVHHLLKNYADADVAVYAVSIDEPRSIAKVKAFTRKNPYNFIWLLDSDKTLAQKFLVENVPHSFIVDKQGKVVYNHSGYIQGDELQLQAQMDALLNPSEQE